MHLSAPVRRSSRRPGRARLVPAVLLGLVGLGLAVPTLAPVAAQAASTSPVRINEVESSGGTPGDWIELVNPSTSTVDLSGFVLKDDDDTHVLTIPTGTTLAAGGYAAFDVEVAYGLGSTDSARLFDTAGELVDSYSWTAHAVGTTYGRCPDATGGFQTTFAVTKGAANSCDHQQIRINEVESSGGVPGDWVELYNPLTRAVDVSGLRFKDNDDTHAFYVLPAGTSIAAKGFLTLEEAQFGFGLGSADSARLFGPDGALLDSYSWTAHAATTYGRCPDGSGPFGTQATVTKGAANDCGSPIRINEIESDAAGSDWIELVNPTGAAIDVSGFVVRGAAASPSLTLPSGSSVPAGGYAAFDLAPDLDLGGSDSARLFGRDGALVDSYSWTSAATTTYGRCPDLAAAGTGAFATTQRPTRGTRNLCPGDLDTAPWPGGSSVRTVDAAGVVGTDLSGLAVDGGVVRGVVNGTGTLVRFSPGPSGSSPEYVLDSRTTLKYPNGTGRPDTEGLALTDQPGRVLVATERDNDAGSVSRPSVLAYDLSGVTTSGGTLTALREWNLASSLPTVGANLGLEGVAWVPDSYLVGAGFVDQTTGRVYDPARYPGHGTGVAFVGLEANGRVYAYALQDDGTATQLASFGSGNATIADLTWDPETQSLWTVCDDTCNGVTTRQQVGASGAFGVVAAYDRPAGLPNYNDEGFALSPQSACVGGSKPVFWSDDSNTTGNALRAGTISCTPPAPGSVAGAVRTDDGAGFDGACVYLYAGRAAASASYATCTDASGSYYLGGVAPGTYQLVATDASGQYATTWREAPVVVSGDVRNVDLTLSTPAPGSVRGRVADGTASGVGIGTACAFLYPRGSSTAARYATCTGADGRYGLEGVDSGQYDLAFFDASGQRPTQWWADGVVGGAPTQAGARPVVVSASVTTIADAVMTPVGVVTGRVVDGAGAPVANVCVYVYPNQSTLTGPARYATCTATDGTYYLGGVAAGSRYRLAFADPSGRLATQWWTGGTGGATTIARAQAIATVRPGGTVSGIDARMFPVS